MDWLTFIANVLQHSLWPLVALAAIFLFRTEIRNLLGRHWKVAWGKTVIEELAVHRKELSGLSTDAAAEVYAVARRLEHPAANQPPAETARLGEELKAALHRQTALEHEIARLDGLLRSSTPINDTKAFFHGGTGEGRIQVTEWLVLDIGPENILGRPDEEITTRVNSFLTMIANKPGWPPPQEHRVNQQHLTSLQTVGVIDRNNTLTPRGLLILKGIARVITERGQTPP